MVRLVVPEVYIWANDTRLLLYSIKVDYGKQNVIAGETYARYARNARNVQKSDKASSQQIFFFKFSACPQVIDRDANIAFVADSLLASFKDNHPPACTNVSVDKVFSEKNCDDSCVY